MCVWIIFLKIHKYYGTTANNKKKYRFWKKKSMIKPIQPFHFGKYTEKCIVVFFSFPLIISFAGTILTTEVLRVELALRWHLQIWRIMSQISPVMIPVKPVSSLTVFDWPNISGNYFSNDFSFSLLSSCRISRKAPVTFLLLWMCPRRWGGEEATGEFSSRRIRSASKILK